MSSSDKYELLNPLCASPFHAWINRFSRILNPAAEQRFSQRSLQSKEVRQQLDADYASACRARTELGLEKSLENIELQLVLFLEKDAKAHKEKGEGTEVDGMVNVLPYLRQIVFAFAPGLSADGPPGAYDLTVRSLWMVTSMFSGATFCQLATPGTFLFGASEACFCLGHTLDALSRRVAEDPNRWVNKFDRWIDKYKLASRFGLVERT
jgi:hypothetical protein